MPTDNRRIPVPDESYSPQNFLKKFAATSLNQIKVEPTDILQKNNLNQRKDGREPRQTRPIFLQAGTVSQAKGSAYIECSRTKVICAVYGPREVTKKEEFSMKGQINCEFKFATFSRNVRGQHQQNSYEKSLSLLVQETLEPAVCLEKFPKARMDVFVTVLQDDGSALAASIICASTALADAGVEMYDLVSSCSLQFYKEVSLFDPLFDEENTLRPGADCSDCGNVTVGYMPSLDQIALLHQQGHMHLQNISKAVDSLIEMCHEIHSIVQLSLMKRVKEKLKDEDV